MNSSLKRFSEQRSYLYTLLLILYASVAFMAFSTEDNDNFETSRREVLLRKIGHEILLNSGDSKSRVLPVEKISENEYQIKFENDFTFLPDTLVNITRRMLVKDPLADTYIVNVLNCGNGSIAYGYAIAKNTKEEIVSCTGRTQPKACYCINIKFKTTESTITKNRYFLGSLPLLAFVGFIFFRYSKKRKVVPQTQSPDTFTLGLFLFDAVQQKLIINEQTIELTTTEKRLLLIFAMSPNEIIERSRLQKEIWEDEGVIVGRSLDMFISKLRKKLEADPNIKIAVIRGKGYKLEILT
jgi:hypothetical protein